MLTNHTAVRDILKVDFNPEEICIRHADLATYLQEHRERDYTIPTVQRNPGDPLSLEIEAAVTIDLSTVDLYEGPIPSMDILPYLFIYLRCPEMQFSTRANTVVIDRIYKFFTELVIPNRDFWTKCVAENRWIKEVRVYFYKDRSLDLVLDPDSDWAREWDCSPYIEQREMTQARVFTVCLGLNIKLTEGWEGHVVIGSVEGAQV
jgi:hypothetical protein